jgi:hypothetical protein
MILDVDPERFAEALASRALALRTEHHRTNDTERLRLAAESFGLRRRPEGWQLAGDLRAQARALVHQHARLDTEALAKRLTAVCLDDAVRNAWRDGTP